MKILILFPFLLTYATVEGLKCYTCSTTADETDQTCLTDPASAGITDCDKLYCISVRVDYVDPKDTFQSISRTCVDKPTFTNEILEDETYRSYYIACQVELCNDGTGLDIGTITSNIQGDAVTLFVPGRGSAGTILVSVSLLVSLLLLLSVSRT